MKNAKKNKHLSFEDRCVIEEFLNNGYNFTQIGNRLSKSRTTIARDVKKHRFLRSSSSSSPCCFESKPPYVCNGCSKFNHCKKIGRFYTDFKDYLEFNPNASIVEMDTVIGTSGGKGGKCFLTLLFRQYNFMLIYLLPYKRSEYVTKIFNYLKDLLGIDEFKRLFEVILTDNGTEFSDPLSI